MVLLAYWWSIQQNAWLVKAVPAVNGMMWRDCLASVLQIGPILTGFGLAILSSLLGKSD